MATYYSTQDQIRPRSAAPSHSTSRDEFAGSYINAATQRRERIRGGRLEAFIDGGWRFVDSTKVCDSGSSNDASDAFAAYDARMKSAFEDSWKRPGESEDADSSELEPDAALTSYNKRMGGAFAEAWGE